MDQRMASSALYQRGLVLKKARMFHMAIEDFRQAAHDPQHAPQAYIQMALCYKAIDRADEAVEALRRASTSSLLSPEERLHVLYHMGRILEEQGRLSESVEVYGWIRKENPAFGDVTARIKHLCAGGRGALPTTGGSRTIRRAAASSWGLRVRSFFQRTGRWLDRTSQPMPRNAGSRLERARHYDREAEGGRSLSGSPLTAPSDSAGTDRAPRKPAVEHRRYVRMPIRLPSSFAVKGRMVAGKGELRDLSPWGCRISSAVSIPIGTSVQCCIFCGQPDEALLIEEATVRWIGPREFGLAFTAMSPAVQERLMRLCRVAA
ncbi:MAG: PilZ domain-containing protein [Nitrospira sp.]|nr:PilZ domain-containing protein [Nitrospira sp.]